MPFIPCSATTPTFDTVFHYHTCYTFNDTNDFIFLGKTHVDEKFETELLKDVAVMMDRGEIIERRKITAN